MEGNGEERTGMEWRGLDRKGREWSGKDWKGEVRKGLKGGQKQMERYKVELTGITPLLMNKPEEFGFDVQWIEKKASTDYEKEALKKLYIDADKRIYQPSTHIEQALIEAGKKVKVKGSGKSTYSKLFGSMVSVEEGEILHEKTDFEIHKELVVIPTTKGRIMRYRPMFKKWKITFHIIAEEEIPSDVIKEALEIAGKYGGLGDWRPAKKGKFGKFQVTSFSKVK